MLSEGIAEEMFHTERPDAAFKVYFTNLELQKYCQLSELPCNTALVHRWIGWLHVSSERVNQMCDDITI